MEWCFFNSTFSRPNLPTARKGLEREDIVSSARKAARVVSLLAWWWELVSPKTFLGSSQPWPLPLCEEGVQGRALCPGFRAGVFPSHAGSGAATLGSGG